MTGVWGRACRFDAWALFVRRRRVAENDGFSWKSKVQTRTAGRAGGRSASPLGRRAPAHPSAVLILVISAGLWQDEVAQVQNETKRAFVEEDMQLHLEGVLEIKSQHYPQNPSSSEIVLAGRSHSAMSLHFAFVKHGLFVA